MFDLSARFGVLDGIRNELTGQLRIDFVTELVDSLKKEYDRKNKDESISVLVWVAQQEGYGTLVGGRNFKLEPYEVLDRADRYFDTREAFGIAFETVLNRRFYDDGDDYVKVRIDNQSEEDLVLKEMIHFKADPYHGFD